MQNINTKEYWEARFRNGSWNKIGQKQTKEYALANIKNIDLSSNFSGTILDFGCAQGDAIPIYKEAFSKARIYGIDISEFAIETCRSRYGDIADFTCGDYKCISPKDVIIASHIMEHLSNDKTIIKDLLTKCKFLYVFVPFKEDPLFYEHVNYYNENYYSEFDVIFVKTFVVNYQHKNTITQTIRHLLSGRIKFNSIFSKEIIMYKIHGSIK